MIKMGTEDRPDDWKSVVKIRNMKIFKRKMISSITPLQQFMHEFKDEGSHEKFGGIVFE